MNFKFGDQEFAMGWVDDQLAVDQFVSTLAKPTFSLAAPHLTGSGENVDVFFWEAEEKVLGKRLPVWDQSSIGSCVSHGAGRAVQDLLLIQIALGNGGWEGNEVAREPIYGGSRVQVGGGQIRGDGSIGAWAAQWLEKWGIVLYGPSGIDGTYNVARCRTYGDRGVPQEVQEKARLHPVKTVTQVKTAQESRDALSNGYPICICGMISRTTKRQPGGWCPQTGYDWAHCFKPGTMITGTTVKPIEDIKVGEQVIGHDGRLHKVIKTFQRKYEGDMISINCVGRKNIESTTEHPYLVKRKNLLAWIPASEIEVGDRLLVPVYRYEGEPEIPQWGEGGYSTRNIPKPIDKPSDDLAWLFGLFAGDGNIVRNHRICFTLSNKEVGTIGRVVKILTDYNLKARIVPKETYVRIYCDSAILARFFETNFYKNKKKILPEFLFKGWNLSAVLDGLFDSDGNYTPSGNKLICNTSLYLAEQIWMMLISIGENPKITSYHKSKEVVFNGKKYNRNRIYHVNYGNKGKNCQTHIENDFYHLPVKSISREKYTGDVYNFEVAEVNSYIANGVAVHNCQQLCGVCVTRDGTPAFVYRNSWGDYLGSTNNKVELKSGRTVELPAGCYLSDFDSVENDLRRGDSFAYSHAEGWPSQKLSWYI